MKRRRDSSPDPGLDDGLPAMLIRLPPELLGAVLGGTREPSMIDRLRMASPAFRAGWTALGPVRRNIVWRLFAQSVWPGVHRLVPRESPDPDESPWRTQTRCVCSGLTGLTLTMCILADMRQMRAVRLHAHSWGVYVRLPPFDSSRFTFTVGIPRLDDSDGTGIDPSHASLWLGWGRRIEFGSKDIPRTELEVPAAQLGWTTPDLNTFLALSRVPAGIDCMRVLCLVDWTKFDDAILSLLCVHGAVVIPDGVA